MPFRSAGGADKCAARFVMRTVKPVKQGNIPEPPVKHPEAVR